MDEMVAYLEFGGAEIKGSERRGAKLAWAVGPEKEVSSLFPRPQALPGPRQRLAPVAAPAHGDPRVVPVDLMPQLAALYLEAGPAGWEVPVPGHKTIDMNLEERQIFKQIYSFINTD